MSHENEVIKVTNISKCYRIYSNPIDRLLENTGLAKRKSYKEIWALRNINFILEKGCTLGIIGRNGSGKSTLLQIICGTMKASEGMVEHHGRIGALLELGSGFNPEYSGIDNIMLNAAILGLGRKEIKAVLQDIVEFADIGDFIEQPIKTYSSGMVVRLAFSVQAFINPSILIVDEALAVGDELFQKKCFNRLESLKANGCSIVLVSHSTMQINRHCDRVILIDHGRIIEDGESHKVTSIYQNILSNSSHQPDGHRNSQEEGSITKSFSSYHISSDIQEDSERWDKSLISESRVAYTPLGVEITNIWASTVGGEKANIFNFGEAFSVIIEYRAMKDYDDIRIGCFVSNASGRRVGGQSLPEDARATMRIEGGESKKEILFFEGCLWPGIYFLGCGVTEKEAKGLFLHRIIDGFALRIKEDKPVIAIGEVNLKRRLRTNATTEIADN